MFKLPAALTVSRKSLRTGEITQSGLRIKPLIRLLRLIAYSLLDRHGRSNGFLNLQHLLDTFIFVPRPEESSQAVFSAPRNDVHMEMRNALANSIVDAHKGAVCVKSLLDRA